MTGRWLGLLACAGVAACGSGIQTGRVGAPVALPSGKPQTRCEREQWYELAPAQVKATGMEAGVAYNTHYSAVYKGLGVFQFEQKDPEKLEDVWPKINEPELRRAHEARIEPVDAASARSLNWSLVGLGGLVVGVGTAAAIQKESGTAAAVAGVSGLVVGLVGVVMALAAQPSGPAQVQADARRSLLIPEEDDLDAAGRGVDRANASTRAQCTKR